MIDIDKFIASLLQWGHLGIPKDAMCFALKEQGLEFRDGSIVSTLEEKEFKPKFKVGDKVRLKGSCGWYNVTEILGSQYHLTSNDVVPCLLPICQQDDWELVEQKPVEWSEEDDMVLNSILDSIQREGVLEKKRKTDWLKSLRPQNKWRPSEEQMNALHDAAVYVDKSMFPYPKGILMKLYEQLKKLKG